MAFQTQQVPAEAYMAAKTRAAQMRVLAVDLRSQAVAGTATSSKILGFAHTASRAVEEFDRIKAIPGIGQFARDQHADAGYDVAAEFTEMVDTLTAARDWIVADFPRNPQGGWALAHTIDADGNLVDRVFPAALVSDLVDILDTVLAAIA